jgi:hypothetical protein
MGRRCQAMARPGGASRRWDPPHPPRASKQGSILEPPRARRLRHPKAPTKLVRSFLRSASLLSSLDLSSASWASSSGGPGQAAAAPSPSILPEQGLAACGVARARHLAPVRLPAPGSPPPKVLPPMPPRGPRCLPREAAATLVDRGAPDKCRPRRGAPRTRSRPPAPAPDGPRTAPGIRAQPTAASSLSRPRSGAGPRPTLARRHSHFRRADMRRRG